MLAYHVCSFRNSYMVGHLPSCITDQKCNTLALTRHSGASKPRAISSRVTRASGPVRTQANASVRKPSFLRTIVVPGLEGLLSAYLGTAVANYSQLEEPAALAAGMFAVAGGVALKFVFISWLERKKEQSRSIPVTLQGTELESLTVRSIQRACGNSLESFTPFLRMHLNIMQPQKIVVEGQCEGALVNVQDQLQCDNSLEEFLCGVSSVHIELLAD